MKRNRTYLFIVISSLALIIVLIIQVNWILQTARMKEKIFNDKANMVLSKTAEALSADKAAYRNLRISVGSNEVNKIDSLFNHYMELYDIHIEYYFEVSPSPVPVNSIPGWTINSDAGRPGHYQACIGGVSENSSMDLRLVFPGREKFIRAEMGTPFITSILLILVVLVMSWRTILSLLKEKRISEHTTDFLNNMTHEFKTPLTNIALAGRMLTKDGGARQEDYTRIILEENEKLRLQVEQVLSMTALERGEIPLKKAACDLHQLVHDALQRMSLQVGNKQGSVRTDPEARNFVVMGDRMHLTNALCNLVDNAIKYARERPELHIRTSNRGPHVVLEVSDKGAGIDKEYQKKVFDKFFRVPTGDVHDVKGFGLGLAYIKKIVALHGGTIELRSRKGSGTTFTIALPYV